MSRFGVESKPAWSTVPEKVRLAAETLLGAPIRRAVRVYGGYAPSGTYRLLLEDGRRVFMKGIGGAVASEYMKQALQAEERTYRRLGALVEPWAPEYYGSFKREGWHAVLLEDLGPANVPPWTAHKLKAAALSFAGFHRSTTERRVPRWLKPSAWQNFATVWTRFLAHPTGIGELSALAGRHAARARTWLGREGRVLGTSAERLMRPRSRDALLHLDTRSDNVRLSGGRLRIFDWNMASVGPPEFDVAMFASSIAAEGGPAPELFVSHYDKHLPLDPDWLAASVSGLAGYFCSMAWQPPIANLPRLRMVQRRMLQASLSWAARLHDLPEPGWVGGLALKEPSSARSPPSRARTQRVQ